MRAQQQASEHKQRRLNRDVKLDGHPARVFEQPSKARGKRVKWAESGGYDRARGTESRPSPMELTNTESSNARKRKVEALLAESNANLSRLDT